MRPFSTSEKCSELTNAFIAAEVFKVVFPALLHREKLSFLRLWMAEGTPYAFRDSPMLYQVSREWLASELGISPRNVTVIGSGRMGFSLAPHPDFGRLFSEESDLDYSIISDTWFDRLREDFRNWSRDYDAEEVHPRNKREERFWEQNINSGVPNGIDRGFIDPYLLSTLPRYNSAVRIMDLRFRLHEKLKASPSAPRVQKVSLRIYKDFQSFVSQLAFNLAILSAHLTAAARTADPSDRTQCADVPR